MRLFGAVVCFVNRSIFRYILNFGEGARVSHPGLGIRICRIQRYFTDYSGPTLLDKCHSQASYLLFTGTIWSIVLQTRRNAWALCTRILDPTVMVVDPGRPIVTPFNFQVFSSIFMGDQTFGQSALPMKSSAPCVRGAKRHSPGEWVFLIKMEWKPSMAEVATGWSTVCLVNRLKLSSFWYPVQFGCLPWTKEQLQIARHDHYATYEANSSSRMCALAVLVICPWRGTTSYLIGSQWLLI